MKSTIICSIAILSLFTACRKNEDVTKTDYRNIYTGSYSGTHDSHVTYPLYVDSTDEWTTYHSIDNDEGVMHVSKGECDSCLLLELELVNKPERNWSNEYTVHADGTVYIAGGGGSMYYYTRFEFYSDSLYMYDFSKCGIPCDSWRVMTANKVE